MELLVVGVAVSLSRALSVFLFPAVRYASATDGGCAIMIGVQLAEGQMTVKTSKSVKYIQKATYRWERKSQYPISLRQA
jgi:hypothetical protein